MRKKSKIKALFTLLGLFLLFLNLRISNVYATDYHIQWDKCTPQIAQIPKNYKGWKLDKPIKGKGVGTWAFGGQPKVIQLYCKWSPPNVVYDHKDPNPDTAFAKDRWGGLIGNRKEKYRCMLRTHAYWVYDHVNEFAGVGDSQTGDPTVIPTAFDIRNTSIIVYQKTPMDGAAGQHRVYHDGVPRVPYIGNYKRVGEVYNTGLQKFKYFFVEDPYTGVYSSPHKIDAIGMQLWNENYIDPKSGTKNIIKWYNGETNIKITAQVWSKTDKPTAFVYGIHDAVAKDRTNDTTGRVIYGDLDYSNKFEKSTRFDFVNSSCSYSKSGVSDILHATVEFIAKPNSPDTYYIAGGNGYILIGKDGYWMNEHKKAYETECKADWKGKVVNARIGVDTHAPDIAISATNDSVTLKAVDKASGVYKIELLDASNKTVKSNERSKTLGSVSELPITLYPDEIKNVNAVKIRVEDNVGNKIVRTVSIKQPKIVLSISNWNYEDPNPDSKGNMVKWYNKKTPVCIQEVSANKNKKPTGNLWTLEGYSGGKSKFIGQVGSTSKFNPQGDFNYVAHSGMYSVSKINKINYNLLTTNTKVLGTKSGIYVPKGNAYIQSGGTTEWFTDPANEGVIVANDKAVVGIDVDPPKINNLNVSDDGISGSVTDKDSGIYEIKVYDNDGKVQDKIFSKKATKVTTTSVDARGNLHGGRVVIYDNVGNIYAEKIPKENNSVGVGINVDNKSLAKVGTGRIFTGLSHGSKPVNYGGVSSTIAKKSMKVEAITGYYPLDVWYTTWYCGSKNCTGHSERHEFEPIVRFFGDGRNVYGPTLGTSLFQLDKTIWVEDDVNTDESPNVSYHRNGYQAYLKWNSMKDKTEYYHFGIEVKKYHDSDYTTEVEYHNVKFATGYSKFCAVVYPSDASGAIKGPSVHYLCEDALRLDVTDLRSGWYVAYVTMYDKNGNPSGTAVYKFYQNQPGLVTPFDISINAVKDVDWEGIGGIEYKETDGISNYINRCDRSYFPIGGKCTAEGTQVYKDTNHNKIAKGYAIHYSLTKENGFELSDLTINYKFTTPSGKLLKLYQNGKPLQQVDSSEHTKFCSYKLSSSEVDSLNKTHKFYVKHFLPVNFTASIASTGEDYVGDVVVKPYFRAYVGNHLDVQSLELYQIDMTQTALDDIKNDKQR